MIKINNGTKSLDESSLNVLVKSNVVDPGATSLKYEEDYNIEDEQNSGD